MTAAGERIEALQVLRGAAATAVVLNHAFPGTAAGLASGALIVPPRIVALGAAGVDLFFILSGFLMVHIAAPWVARRRSVGAFVARRLIRVWPLYALATLAACLPLAARAFATGVVPFELRPVRLAGIAFLPSFNAYRHVVPILVVGWTLDCEILFYLCFAVVLLGSPRWLPAKVATIFVVLHLVGLSLGGSAIGAFLANTVVVEFVIGMAIAQAWHGGHRPRRHGVAMLAAGVVLLLATAAHPGLEGGTWRPLVFGVPMTLVFLAFLAFERVAWPAALCRLGDASYSIYLAHLPVFDALREPLRAWWRVRNWPLPALAPALLLAFLALCVGVMCFMWVERPLLRACQRLYNRLTGAAWPPPMAAASAR